MNNDKLRKALDTIALQYTEGNCSTDILIKACNNYKIRTGFNDDFNYALIVAKSCIDSINRVSKDNEIEKGIVPGQTKVVDGILYIYSATKNGSKTQYDWHVARTQAAAAKMRNKNIDDKSAAKKSAYVNDLFPKDLNSLTVVKRLGGSTGAQLVKDVNGRQFVKKIGSNTSNEHVESEYRANQLYQILGCRVPDYELYDDGKNKVLLSRFIPGLKEVNKYSGDKACKQLAEHAIADVLLANWDVYCNDNSNYDSAGRIIRVDNGGSLDYRAQGAKKVFDGDVKKTFDDMVVHNKAVFDQLKPADGIKQIQEIRKNKDKIIQFMKDSNYPKNVVDAIFKRIDNLSEIEKVFTDQQNAYNKQKNRIIRSRTILPAAQMYRKFSDKEVQDFYDNATGSNYTRKFSYKGKFGWDLLHTICVARGFDARPRVVEDDEYWKFCEKSKFRQMFRGVRNGDVTADFSINQFKFEDDDFVGVEGIYGAGLYFHMNDGDLSGGNGDRTKTTYTNSDAYDHANNYARGNQKNIILAGLEDDFKLIDIKDLQDKVKELAAGKDKKKADSLKDKMKSISDECFAINDKIRNYSDIIRQKIYLDNHYDEAAVIDLQETIDTLTNWGHYNKNGELDFPKFDEFVRKECVKWITANGGTVVERHGELTFSLPNSKEKITIQRFVWDNPHCIRQSNPMAPFYHLYAERFKDWFLENHVKPVQDKVNTAIQNDDGKMLKELKDQLKGKNAEYDKTEREYKKIIQSDPNKNIYQGALDAGKHSLGVIAAILGYDGIKVKNGNGGKNSFIVVLNRSKVVVNKIQ